LFFRFAGFVSFLVLIFLITVGALLYLYRPLAGYVWLAGCGLALLFLLSAGFAGWRAFREFGGPLANLMAAADAIAEGDLSVRVPENGRGEFGRLAHSFNNMTAELERAEQQRRNLTADIAHELRTPLHIIQGNLEGILDGVYEPEAEHIQATLDETRLLTRLVDDLQTLSLAEAGRLTLHLERIDVKDLLADVRTSFSGQAEAAGVRLESRLPDEPGDLIVWGDPDRVDQVLSNLVANALRYTPPSGQIVLAAEPCEGGVCLSVADSGAGIPPEDLPYVFDRFWRGDRARTRQVHTGSGLGLAIAKQLVQLQGGTIEVASQVGEGTTFTIRLPSPATANDNRLPDQAG
jgi:two-component system OmpR family sensor kinase/two-component system sensor histidine kinase BaeS